MELGKEGQGQRMFSIYTGEGPTVVEMIQADIDMLTEEIAYNERGLAEASDADRAALHQFALKQNIVALASAQRSLAFWQGK